MPAVTRGHSPGIYIYLKISTFSSFFNNSKGPLIDLQNSHNFFGESSRLDATVLTEIISKCAVNFELKPS
jgi:hypothetical protein